jgi:sugar O-acyltransferase (sialic acid O-acetyltransferase NeuD family)
MTRLLIVGAGGFGREMYQAVMASPSFRKREGITSIAYLDDGTPPLLRAPIAATIDGYSKLDGDIGLCAIGSPHARRGVVARLATKGLAFPAFVDDRAHVGDNVALPEGAIVCCGSVLTVDIGLGKHVHINTQCTIGHDVVIGDFCTLSPKCNLTGGVRVGDSAFFGTAATVIPGKSIGDGARVGAGSVVVRNVSAEDAVFGNPARRIWET